MSGYRLDVRTGRVRAGETDMLWLPHTLKPGSHPVILCHGANSPNQFIHPNTFVAAALGAILADNGYVAVSGWFNGNAFGNDLNMGAMDLALALVDAVSDCDTSKAHFFGSSMGNASGVRYAGLNPGKVASITGMAPYSDVTAVYTSNRLGLGSTIAAAWGVTYPAALPATANLIDTHASVVAANEIPTLAYYGGADTAAPPSEVNALFTAMGADADHRIQVDNVNNHNEALTLSAAKWGGGTLWSHYLDFLEGVEAAA